MELHKLYLVDQLGTKMIYIPYDNRGEYFSAHAIDIVWSEGELDIYNLKRQIISNFRSYEKLSFDILTEKERKGIIRIVFEKGFE